MKREDDPPVIARADNQTDALLQEAQQCRTDVADTENRLGDVSAKITKLLRQYRKLAHIHNFEDRHLPGFGETTRRDEEQTRKARLDRFAAICFAILSVGVLTWFSTLAFESVSTTWLIVAAIAVALLFAWGFAAVMRRLINAHPEHPESEKRIIILLWVFGFLMIASLAAFGWLRFVEDEAALAYVSLTIAGIEIGLFGVGAAFDCGHQIFSWSKDYDDGFQELTQEKKRLEALLKEHKGNLLDAEIRLAQLNQNVKEEYEKVGQI